MTTESQIHLKVSNLHLATKQDFELDIESLEVFKGECVAVVGANGSGKTTLIESLLGLRETSSGDISLLGMSYRAFINNEVKHHRLGVQLQNVSYPDNYKVKEIAQLHYVAYGIKSEPIYKLLDIQSLENKKYVKLSRGQKQRVDLYVAFAHDPELLILDEPSTGLDETFKKGFVQLMEARLADPEKSTLIVTHTGEELCQCNKIVWIQNGRVLRTLAVEQPFVKGVIAEKLLISYTQDKDELLQNLNALEDVSFIGEDGFNSLVAFGPNLESVLPQVEKMEGVSMVQRTHSIGSEFLKFVASESVEMLAN